MIPKKLKIQTYNQKNRAIQTTAEFKQGQLILSSQPIAFAVLSNCRKLFCNVCLLKKESLLKCTICTTFYYCSANCQKIDWPIHKEQCKIYERICKQKKFKITSQFILLVRLYLKTKKSPQIAKQVDQFLNLNDYQSQQKRNYFKEMAICVIENFQLQKSMQNIQKLITLSNKIAINAFTIQDYLFDYQGIAIALYYPANFINHSCAPNAVQLFDGNKLKIIALKNIDAQDEINISYIDQLLDLKQRNKLLRQSYLFDCSCYQCLAQKTVKLEFLDLICQKCQKGNVKSLDKSQYKCSNCQKDISQKQVQGIQAQIKELKTILEKSNEYDKLIKAFFGLKKMLRFSNPYFAKILQNLYITILTEANIQKDIFKQQQKFQNAYKILKAYIKNFKIWYKMDQDQYFHVLLLWKYSEMGKLARYLNKLKKSVIYTEKAIQILKKCGFSDQLLEVKQLKTRYQQLQIECRMNMTTK